MSRTVCAGFFVILYLVFLAWYDGWGRSPLTQEEVEQYIANVPEDFEIEGFVDRLREMGSKDDGQEFFMLNLNRYEYSEGESGEGIPAAYQAYSDAVLPMVLGNAGHPVYVGQFPGYLLTGDSARADWHSIILVRYRSKRDFISMVTSDAYQEIAAVRAGGIDYAEVTPTMPALNLATPRLLVLLIIAVLAMIADRVLKSIQAPRPDIL